MHREPDADVEADADAGAYSLAGARARMRRCHTRLDCDCRSYSSFLPCPVCNTTPFACEYFTSIEVKRSYSNIECLATIGKREPGRPASTPRSQDSLAAFPDAQLPRFLISRRHRPLGTRLRRAGQARPAQARPPWRSQPAQTGSS